MEGDNTFKSSVIQNNNIAYNLYTPKEKQLQSL